VNKQNGKGLSVRAATTPEGTLSFEAPMGGLSRRPLMVDAESMKEKVRETLTKPEYNVADFYWKTGIWRRIATNPIFENLTLGVISFNALWIAIDTDGNGAATLLDAQPIFQIAEQGFCWYFSFEWYVRFQSFQAKRNGLKDAWFVFDSALVFMMVFETWLMTVVLLLIGGGGGASPLGNASILRMLRLLRLSRLARMLRSMPELMILIKGMMVASRSVFFTMCLLLILLYLFAIALRQLSENTEAGALFFPGVPDAMYTLLIEGVFLDNLGTTCKIMAQSSPLFVVVFFVFICMAALMVMNMLIGVLCEVVSAVASTEKEEMSVAHLKWSLEQVMQDLDDSGNGKLSKDEFCSLLQQPKAIQLLDEVGVDPFGLFEQADDIFAPDDDDLFDSLNGSGNTPPEKELDFPAFISIVLACRDKQGATAKDIRDLRWEMNKEMAELRMLILHPNDSKQRTKATRSSQRVLSRVSSVFSGENGRPRSFSVDCSPNGMGELVGGGGFGPPRQPEMDMIPLSPSQTSMHGSISSEALPPLMVAPSMKLEDLSDTLGSKRPFRVDKPADVSRQTSEADSIAELSAAKGQHHRSMSGDAVGSPTVDVEELESMLQTIQIRLCQVQRRPTIPNAALDESEKALQDWLIHLGGVVKGELSSLERIRQRAS
jgi:hypothetical protein